MAVGLLPPVWQPQPPRVSSCVLPPLPVPAVPVTAPAPVALEPAAPVVPAAP